MPETVNNSQVPHSGKIVLIGTTGSTQVRVLAEPNDTIYRIFFADQLRKEGLTEPEIEEKLKQYGY